MRPRLVVPLSLLAGMLLAVLPAEASILTFPGTTKKVPPFPRGSTLKVAIEKDPKHQGRDTLLEEGVKRWTKPLKDRGITLTTCIVEKADLPKPKDNNITYTWVNSGQLGQMEVGPGKNNGAAQPIASKEGDKLIGGEVIIHNGLPEGTDDTKKNLLRNVGEHELAHTLGLADDGRAAVTAHEQSGAVRTPNDFDKKELNSLYGTAKTGGTKTPKGKATKTGGGGGMGFFQYQFNFEPANLVADLDDPEHVAIINLGIAPQFVTGLELPPGWIALVPSGPLDISDPFFAEGYMIDGAPNPTPWLPGPPPAFVALRTSVQEAANDGLPAGADPALTLDNASFDITIHTRSGLSDGLIGIWAGGELQTVPGPVPEPASWALIGVGLLAAAWVARRRGDA